MGYTTCSRHNRKCCWRCDACPKCDGITLLRGSYCVECTAKFKAEGAVWIPDYKNYISAEDYAQHASVRRLLCLCTA
jgi:hypothetical protein